MLQPGNVGDVEIEVLGMGGGGGGEGEEEAREVSIPNDVQLYYQSNHSRFHSSKFFNTSFFLPAQALGKLDCWGLIMNSMWQGERQPHHEDGAKDKLPHPVVVTCLHATRSGQ